MTTTETTDHRFTFNLLDDPWLPCLVPGAHGSVRRDELGLRAVLGRAHEIAELSTPSPLITVALYRLLIAVAHRVFGPADAEAWRELWDARQPDAARLDAYLDSDALRGRFDLFDAEHPFYQAPRLGVEYGASIAKLTHEQANTGNAVLLSDHGWGAAATGLTPAEAARYLVAYQAYAVGGLISYEKGQDPKVYKSASAGPLVKGAVVLVRGDTLWETLLLNMVRYPREQWAQASGEPDRPVWERDDEPTALPRYPAGYLDLLTWQSRRVHLFPETDERGRVVVKRAAAMKGHPFPPGFERRAIETMTPFSHNEKAKTAEGQDPYPPLVFRDERALWRDSAPLLAVKPGKSWRPATLGWLDELGLKRQLQRKALPLDVLGMRSDQAKVLAWHHERLAVPLDYLNADNADLFEGLGIAVGLADWVGRALRDGVRELAKLLIASEADHRSARQPLPADVNGLAVSLGVERVYWAALDEPFARFLMDLPGAPQGTPFEDHAREALDRWAEELHRAANGAFDGATAGLDTSARALKAAALGQRAQRAFVAKALDVYGRPRGSDTGGQESDADNAPATAPA